MLRVLAALAFATTLALPTEDDRGRPVVILVHGRAMLDRDTAATRKLWLNALTAGGKSITALPLLSDRDVRVVWYADVLDPRSSAGCDYASSDARARRNATIDPDLKALVATAAQSFWSRIVSDRLSPTTISRRAPIRDSFKDSSLSVR